jgi:hypothetical protein
MTTKEATENVVTVEVLDEVNDLVEEALDAIEAVQTKNYTMRYVGLALIVGSTAAFVTYRIVKKRLKEEYAEIARQEIEEARAYYSRNAKPASPAELAERYADEKKEDEAAPADVELAEVRRLSASYRSDDIEEARATLEEKPEEPVAPVNQNVFEMADPGTDEFDYEEEERKRSEDEPYILSHDEFMASEKDYQQVQFTYYEGDDVLCDEKDQVVEDEDAVVGAANLLQFGHGSKDRNIVYIRNDRLQLEFEVVKSDGKYAEQVLGFIEHSDDDKRPRRFRVNRDD